MALGGSLSQIAMPENLGYRVDLREIAKKLQRREMSCIRAISGVGRCLCQRVKKIKCDKEWGKMNSAQALEQALNGKYFVLRIVRDDSFEG